MFPLQLNRFRREVSQQVTRCVFLSTVTSSRPTKLHTSRRCPFLGSMNRSVTSNFRLSAQILVYIKDFIPLVLSSKWTDRHRSAWSLNNSPKQPQQLLRKGPDRSENLDPLDAVGIQSLLHIQENLRRQRNCDSMNIGQTAV